MIHYYAMYGFTHFFGKSARTISVALDIPLTIRGKGTSKELAMCGFPIGRYDLSAFELQEHPTMKACARAEKVAQ